jgi:hypothetical protein
MNLKNVFVHFEMLIQAYTLLTEKNGREIIAVRLMVHFSYLSPIVMTRQLRKPLVGDDDVVVVVVFVIPLNKALILRSYFFYLHRINISY